MRVVLSATALLIALALSGAASAGGPPVSAVDQYVEAIPSSSGEHPAGKRGKARPIPRDVAKAIDRQGGNDARTLKAIVSSPAYGAPGATTAKKQEPEKRSPRPEVVHKSLTVPDPGIVAAALGPSDGSGTTTWWLVAGVLSLSLAGAIAKIARRIDDVFLKARRR